MGIYLIMFLEEKEGGIMKKISLLVIIFLIISLITSCGIGDLANENLNQDKNIIEKADEEKNAEDKPIDEKEDEITKDKDIKEGEDQTPIDEEEKIQRQIDEKDQDESKDKRKEFLIVSENVSNLKTIEKKGYATVNDLNVRSLGSMKGKIITVIDKGVEVYVFGERDSWYYVEYAKNKQGWIYSRYIQVSPIKNLPPKDPPKTPDLRKIEKKGDVTVNNLNVRTLGSTKGKIITSLNKGIRVHVFGEKDNWYYVEYAKNKKGWVFSDYVKLDRGGSPPKDTSSLSNKSYSWYFIRNSKHQQPGFDKTYKALLDKYDGITIGNKNTKKIFLTFDNGYENGYTLKILDILKRQNIRVAFFVQGTYIDANPDIVKRMAKEGHLVLNHTNNHPEMPSISQSKLDQEINIVAQKYKKLTGQNMQKFLRPPSGVFSERTLADTKKLGYRTVFWSMAYRDWVVDDQPGKAASYKHVVDNVHSGAVILLHAVSKSNTEALEDIIKELKRQGYSFKLLTQYP